MFVASGGREGPLPGAERGSWVRLLRQGSRIPRPGTRRGAALAALLACAAVTPDSRAGEGGTSHVLPGANATLVDVLPASSGNFLKPMYVNYSGSVSARIPTAAGIVSNADVTSDAFVFGGGRTFDTTVLGGAYYSMAAFLPYSWLDIRADALGPGGATMVRRKSSVDGLGDLTIVPVMLAWKSGENLQYDFLMPVYVPTGDYEKGRLGNPGLNYWTVDPVFGVNYSNKKTGFNALLHVGYAMNTENNATNYRSGSLAHLDGAVEQLLPVGGGYLALGAEGFYFKQVTGDSGTGARLGDFKGMTAGLGPVLGYIKPLGEDVLLLEFKWLAELDTRRRLEGDYLWLRAAYRF